MGKTPHTATYKGHWVKVKLRSGEEFTDQFIERTKNKRVIFKDREVRQGDIKSFVPWGSNSLNVNKKKPVLHASPSQDAGITVTREQEPLKKRNMRRSAKEIVIAYFKEPARFVLEDAERAFIEDTFMQSGGRRLSTEAVREKFFPELSQPGVSYRTWKILDKILEQMTAPVVTGAKVTVAETIDAPVGKTVAKLVPEAVQYSGDPQEEGTLYTSDMNVAAAILCFGEECKSITADTAGRFEFSFRKCNETVWIRDNFAESIAVSPLAMALNLKTLRAVIARWYRE